MNCSLPTIPILVSPRRCADVDAGDDRVLGVVRTEVQFRLDRLG
jgi:hypothetical protein